MFDPWYWPYFDPISLSTHTLCHPMGVSLPIPADPAVRSIFPPSIHPAALKLAELYRLAYFEDQA